MGSSFYVAPQKKKKHTDYENELRFQFTEQWTPIQLSFNLIGRLQTNDDIWETQSDSKLRFKF